MPPEIIANGSQSQLAAAAAAADTTLSVASAAGVPATGNSRVLVDTELMLVTAVAGNVLTVARAQEGTVAAAHASGAAAYLNEMTAAGLKAAFSRGGPTLTVAASNSLYPGRADFVCTGTNDHTTVVNAINALPLNAAGVRAGRVTMMEGDYHYGGTVGIPSYTEVEGMGWGTIVHLNNAVNDYAFTAIPDTGSVCTGAAVRFMQIDGNCYGQYGGAAGGAGSGGINAKGFRGGELAGVFLHECYSACVDFQQAANGQWPFENLVRGLLCTLGKNSGDAANSGYAINLHDAEENHILGNSFEFNGKAHIVDNVVGNNTIMCNTFVNGQVGIWTGGSRGRYTDNVFDSLGGHNIRCSGNNNHIRGNSCFLIGAGAAANSASGITLNWGASGNLVEDNVLMTHSTNGQTRYLIDDNADGGNNTVGNMIRGNALLQSGTPGTALANASQAANTWDGNKGLNTAVSPWTAIWADIASGIATVAAGTTSIVVTHGMGVTPRIYSATPGANPGSYSWIDTITATALTIHLGTAPAAAVPFAWRAALSAGA